MGEVTRVASIFTNFILLIIIFIILFIIAIMSSVILDKMKKIKDQTPIVTALKNIKFLKKYFWIFVVGSLIFFLTIGFFLTPWLISFPYIFGILIIIFSLINLVISGFYFSISSAISKTNDFKKNSEDATKAHHSCIVVGTILLILSLFLIIYSIWTIYDYYKYGGLKSDIKLGTKLITTSETGGSEAVLTSIIKKAGE